MEGMGYVIGKILKTGESLKKAVFAFDLGFGFIYESLDNAIFNLSDLFFSNGVSVFNCFKCSLYIKTLK